MKKEKLNINITINKKKDLPYGRVSPDILLTCIQHPTYPILKIWW